MSFPLVGNTQVRNVIENAIKENRMPHALIIEGEEGTGRHTLCDFIAASAVCLGDNPPCKACRSCQLVSSDSHPDISVVAPEENKKNIAVAQIRELKSETFIKPHIANRRVFIIDKADTMNESSQNALLKVLEEPPADILFILLAASKAALLSTVVSRCVVLSLNAPSDDIAFEFIKSKFYFNENSINEALKINKNNIGQSINMLKGGVKSKADFSANEFLECFLEGDTFGMLKITAEFEKNRVVADLFIKNLKYAVAARLRKSYKAFEGPYLSKLYEELLRQEAGLSANINLGLFFANLVSTAKTIIG